ncbi:MAG: hypothetical protein AB7N76_33345 [Planctomycetota bacterium]
MRRSLLLVPLFFAALALGPSVAGIYDADAYQSLTRAEKRLALRYPWQLLSVYRAARLGRTESEARFPQYPGSDDPRDACRHATWNGSMVRRLESVAAAKRWADAHEDVPQNPAARRQMDLTNNERGRDRTWARRTTNGPWWNRTQFPSDDEVARDMEQAVRNGELVMIEEQNGRRDPQSGALVPTR